MTKEEALSKTKEQFTNLLEGDILPVCAFEIEVYINRND